MAADYLHEADVGQPRKCRGRHILGRRHTEDTKLAETRNHVVRYLWAW